MKKKLLLIPLALLLAISLVAIGCPVEEEAPPPPPPEEEEGPPPEEIPILLVSTTEPPCFCHTYGPPNLEGIRLAIQEINKAGGILNRPADLDVEDVKDFSTSAAQELLQRRKVDFVFFSSGSDIFLRNLWQVAEENRVLVMNSLLKPVELTMPQGEYFIQGVPTAGMEGRVAARTAVQTEGKTYFVIGTDLDSIRAQREAFEAELCRLNPLATIVGETWVKFGEVDFTPCIDEILSCKPKPEAVWSPLFGLDLVKFTRQARQSNLLESVRLVGPYDIKLLQVLGYEMPEDVFCYSWAPFFAETTDKMTRFVEAFLKTYEEYPSDAAIAGYDAMYLLKKGIETVDTTESAAVAEALRRMEFESLRGKIEIRAGLASAPMYSGITVKDERYPFLIWKDVQRIGGTEIWSMR